MPHLPFLRLQVIGPGAERALTAVFLCALAGAFLAGADAHAAEQGLRLSGPWIRLVMPARPAAGYFTLSNETDKALALVGAASPACGTLMLHESLSENGQEQMVMVKSVPIPAHGNVKFAPGGYHLMCMSPSKDVTPGHSIPVTLRFGDNGTLTADFPVRNATGQ
jgi:hypothetical protein